jgi:NAD/NADP transhydrogenase alpha subunit
MYSRNITNFFGHLYKTLDKTKNGTLDFEDEITKSTCITHKGEIMNEIVKKALEKGGTNT